MNSEISVLIIGVVESLIVLGGLSFLLLKDRLALQSVSTKLKNNLPQYELIVQKIKVITDQLVSFEDLKKEVRKLLKAKDALNLERGRISLTSAELEAIDQRLRELEEIERELEASNLETKKELDLLEGKYRELKSKNDSLILHIQENTEKYKKDIEDLQLSDNILQETNKVEEKLDLIQTQTKDLIEQIQNGKNQYIILKRRFDALDIEYAQLYEKYTNK